MPPAALAACAMLLIGCATSDDLPYFGDALVDTGVDPVTDALDTVADTLSDTYTDTIVADTYFDPVFDTYADPVFDTYFDPVLDTYADPVFDTYADTIVADTYADTIVADTYADTIVADTYYDPVLDTYADTITDTLADTVTDIAAHHTWSEYFDGTSNVTQCASWNTFCAGLSTSGYSAMTFSGTYDPTGVTCTDPTVVQQYANALRASTSVHLTCGGRVWSLCNRGSHLEVWIDAPSMCDLSNCPDPGYIIRPCFNTSGNWCAANETTCFGPNQTVTLDFY